MLFKRFDIVLKLFTECIECILSLSKNIISLRISVFLFVISGCQTSSQTPKIKSIPTPQISHRTDNWPLTMHKHPDPIAPLVKCLMKGKLEIICDNIMRLGLMMCYWIRWDNGRYRDEVCNAPTHKWITIGINTFWLCASHHVRIFSLRPGDSVSFRDENFNPFHTQNSSHFLSLECMSIECGRIWNAGVKCVGLSEGNESSWMRAFTAMSFAKIAFCLARQKRRWIAHNCFTIWASVMRVWPLNCTPHQFPVVQTRSTKCSNFSMR